MNITLPYMLSLRSLFIAVISAIGNLSFNLRPAMTAFVNNVEVGRVEEPCPCCDPVFNVVSGSGEKRWTITANCCQCSIFCRQSCGKCCDALFTIHHANKKEMTEQNADGIVIKKYGGMKDFVNDANNFEINFPPDATPQDKLLIIGAVIRIDYTYYEEKGSCL
jgi:hypothetical protein